MPLLSKPTSGAQPLRRGHSHPPSTNDGGASTLTTTLPATLAQATNRCSLSPTRPCPMSYVGAVLSTIGGDYQPSLQVLQATTAHESAAVTLHRMACQHKQPCRRPGRCNVPWAPNPPDEATPSHPQPTMGGTSPPTLSDLMSAGADNQAPCLHLSPSLQPFTIEGATSTYSGGIQ